MSNNKQKLELTWIGKNNPEYDIANIEPRILEECTDLSFGDKDTENMIIHGDNLLALKALLPEYEGKIKCIYIDPPYNTGSAFDHYDDNVEHSTWLSLMKPRLELLHLLLHKEGAIFMQIDDEEFAHLKLLCDEVFLRENFLNVITIRAKSVAGASGGGEDKSLKKNTELLLSYAKDRTNLKYYENYFDIPLKKLIHEKQIEGKKYEYDQIFLNISEEKKAVGEIDSRNGKIVVNKHESFEIKTVKQLEKEQGVDTYQIYKKYLSAIFRTQDSQSSIRIKVRDLTSQYKADLFSIDYVPDSGRNRGKTTRIYYYKGEQVNFLSTTTKVVDDEIIKLRPLGSLWDDISWAGIAKEGQVEFKNGKKPEALLRRIIDLVTQEGDFVLDSFLGSGTSAAVAHKMRRKHVSIEMGQQAYTHCQPRLMRVVDGSDQSGISKAVDWKGGGGYKFYELAQSFVVIDEFGNPVIDSYYNDAKLIRAMCKLTNYTFAPSATEYWKQGKGQGNNSLYVTTQLLSVGNVQRIASHLNKNETLLICPKKFEPGCKEVDARITIKKIPQSILKACQFGMKEYLLPIKERAMEEVDEDDTDDN